MVAESFVATRPEDVGVDAENLEALFARAKLEVESGRIPSAQIAVARHGRLAGMRTFGSAVQGGALRPARDDTLYLLYSCTKAIVGAAVWALFEDGLLRLDERVAAIIPEFGSNGKEVVTVEQTLLHTGGYPSAPLGPGQWETREGRLARFAYWRLNWEPGTRFEYHATAAHWVLAEIIERRTGRDFRRYIRERLLDPAGLHDLFVGLPEELSDRVADVLYVELPDPSLPVGETNPVTTVRFNQPAVRALGVPGGGGIGTAGQLALFYQMLINGGVAPNGNQVLKPETIEFGTTVRTKSFHRMPVVDLPVNRALSVVVAGDHPGARGFGRNASPRAFGHAGAGGQIGWGDPESGISIGFCTNGFTSPASISTRNHALSSLAGACAAT